MSLNDFHPRQSQGLIDIINDQNIPLLTCSWDRIRNCINNILIREGFDEGELLGKWFIKETDASTWERFYSKVVFHLANFVVKEDLEILFSETMYAFVSI